MANSDKSMHVAEEAATEMAFVSSTVLLPAIYCGAHHGNNVYLRRDAVSLILLGKWKGITISGQEESSLFSTFLQVQELSKSVTNW
uniref:Uncharacterized protein n=1 Tax=Oryza brachyantha TaxID=4533 RepID=J3LFS0_ORYBR